MKKIPDHWRRGFKSFTGLEPTMGDYERHPQMFRGSLAEENPVMAWLVFIALWGAALAGIITVFF